MKVSVIFSTYNSPDWLEKVLWGFHYQTCQDFEILVADDGSGDETKQTIDAFRKTTNIPIKHIWHQDHGFQKTKILNKALLASDGDYIIFTDGDCIPRNDFVATHLHYAEPAYFLSGGYFKLPIQTSERITAEDIKNANAFSPDWLIANGLKPSYKLMKLKATGWKEKLLNNFTPTGATWNGHNASTWKQLIVNANGFDERMQYGGEDRELGERLFNTGIRSKQIRYSAICIHLDHPRSYVTEEMKIKNREIRNETKRTKRQKTAYGLVDLTKVS